MVLSRFKWRSPLLAYRSLLYLSKPVCPKFINYIYTFSFTGTIGLAGSVGPDVSALEGGL